MGCIYSSRKTLPTSMFKVSKETNAVYSHEWFFKLVFQQVNYVSGTEIWLMDWVF